MDSFDDMFLAAQAHDAKNLKDINPDKCMEAAAALANAFSWRDSAEGADFWIYVHERLGALGNG